MTIDSAWIDHWASDYCEDDDKVLNEVGPRVRERGCYDRDDLLEVGKWKTQRISSYLKLNSDSMIADITRTALTAPEPIQHRVLTLLNGVQVPVASALLMVWQPTVHTVIDVRAVKTLVDNSEIAKPSRQLYPPYTEYLKVCRDISDRCGRSLRIVDRALYLANGHQAGAPF